MSRLNHSVAEQKYMFAFLHDEFTVREETTVLGNRTVTLVTHPSTLVMYYQLKTQVEILERQLFGTEQK